MTDSHARSDRSTPAAPAPAEISRRKVMGYGAATVAGAAAANALDWGLAPAAGAATPEGAATPAAAVPVVAAAFSDPTGLYPVQGDTPARPALQVVFNPTAALSGSVAWSVSARTGAALRSGTTAFTAPAGTETTTSVALGALDPDFYAVTVTVTDSASNQLLAQTLGLGVIRPTVADRRPDSPFGMGIRSESSPVVTKQIAQRIGVKWTRGIVAVQPDTVSPSPGVFWGRPRSTPPAPRSRSGTATASRPSAASTTTCRGTSSRARTASRCCSTRTGPRTWPRTPTWSTTPSRRCRTWCRTGSCGTSRGCTAGPG